MVKNNLIYDMVLMEADRIATYRYKELDLYYKDPYGEMVKIAEAYDPAVEALVAGVFKKRKMRYFITFTEALDMQEGLRPSSYKLIRFFCRHMTYGNTLKNYGIRDIQAVTAMNTNFIGKGIIELCKRDILRYSVKKGRRTYMINPVFFYKGTMKKLFACVRAFDELPKRDENMNQIPKPKDTIF